MNEQDEKRMRAEAHAIGYQHGTNAGSWVFDGNTDEQTIRTILDGMEDGDPMVMDSLPAPDLSGQWANGYSPVQLAKDVGFEPETDPEAGDAYFEDEAFDQELCDEYDAGFSMGMEDEVQRSGKAMLGVTA